MTDGQIKRALASLAKRKKALTDRFIAEGRGRETHEETMRATDPLARRFQAVALKQRDLMLECERRYGPRGWLYLGKGGR